MHRFRYLFYETNLPDGKPRWRSDEGQNLILFASKFPSTVATNKVLHCKATCRVSFPSVSISSDPLPCSCCNVPFVAVVVVVAVAVGPVDPELGHFGHDSRFDSVASLRDCSVQSVKGKKFVLLREFN